MKKRKQLGRVTVIAVSTALMATSSGVAVMAEAESIPTEISNLRVGNYTEPLAVEDEKPVFSWQMDSQLHGQKQTAYQIVVTKEATGDVVWDSQKQEDSASVDISYNGDSLEPETAYQWTLTVWDKDGKEYTQTSRFETGIMNPDLEGWDGAEFIGTTATALDATSACVWHINTDMQITEGNKASLIVGANDYRLNDQFQNVENVEGENYIRLEFDFSGVSAGNGAKLNIYRVGYAQGDSADTPYLTISAADTEDTNIDELFTPENINDVHNIDIYCETGNITIKVDDQELFVGPEQEGRFGTSRPSLTVSPLSTGNNYNTFPNLNSIGFSTEDGCKATFSNYQIIDIGQSDQDVLFNSTGATYSIFDGNEGIQVDGDNIEVSGNTFVYADPSCGSMPMLRTTFDVTKKVASAKMYVTAMGIYEMYINGQRMGDDWFNPADSQYRDTLCYHAYDVTDMLSEGTNAIGAILSGGWYTGYMTFSPGNYNFFGDDPALLSKLVITYEDGTEDVIVSDDDTWQVYNNGPIEYSSFFQGERYNAEKEDSIEGWSTSDYDTTDWETPDVISSRDWIDFDIVSRYDVDAIHMDDYFYPYPKQGVDFPDDASFARYGGGFFNKADWRRSNVNVLIKKIHETVRELKPWVKFGVSPFGIYRNQKSDPLGSKTNGLQNYDDLYADVLLWAREGWIDYNIPQIYWQIGHPVADYETLVKWWAKNTENRPLFIGQSVMNTVQNADPQTPSMNQLPRKMALQRAYQTIGGSCQWPASAVVENAGKYRDALMAEYHKYPALPPVFDFMDNEAPDKVRKMKPVWTEDGYLLFWTAPKYKDEMDRAVQYVIYRFDAKEKVDISDPSHIVAITRDNFYKLPYENGKTKYRYVVTALDRLHNESKVVAKKVKL